MNCISTYDIKRDKGEVHPGLACDLNQAIDTGVITDTGVDCEYQFTEAEADIARVGNRVDDTFRALDAAKAIAAKVKSQNASNPDKGEAA